MVGQLADAGGEAARGHGPRSPRRGGRAGGGGSGRRDEQRRAGATTNVAATSLEPGAQIRVAGAPPAVGKLEAKAAVGLGIVPVTVDVSAPDGTTRGQYVVNVEGKPRGRR